jgi:hypothetical protein
MGEGGIMGADSDYDRKVNAGQTGGSSAVVPGSATDPFYHSTGTKKEITLPDGRKVQAIDVGSTKPPPATTIGMVSPSSGLTITGTERNWTKEAEARAIGYTAEYLASRGGINSQGYFNDTPISGQLTGEERKSVTLPNGSINTQAMASILQKKQIAELVTNGMSIEEATKKVSSEYGKYGVPLATKGAGGYDANGNPVVGGSYNADGTPAASSSIDSALNAVSNERRDAFAAITTTLKTYGFTDAEMSELQTYLNTVLINPAIGPKQALLDMRQLNAYKARFAGNESRVKSGLNALSESEYLQQEDSYSQYMKSWGVGDLGNRNQYASLIAGDVSATELNKRLDLAVTRVKKSDPEIFKQLQNYYGITETDMVKYVLKPAEMLPELQRKVTAAEIGTAAKAQGLDYGAGRAEGLAAYGIDRAQAIAGYGTIGEIIPTAQKLGNIYSQSGIKYDQTSGEQEFFKANASAAGKRKQLESLEKSAFQSSSGTSKASFASQARGAGQI